MAIPFTRGRGTFMAERRRVDYEQVGSDYMKKRQLQQGAAGWVLLAGLGVAYVISGDFAGWNFGLAEGGRGGMLIAVALMATMYTCMVFSLAELASTISTAGGGYGFGRRALGPWGGFLTGTAVLIEYDGTRRHRRVHRRLRRVARRLSASPPGGRSTSPSTRSSSGSTCSCSWSR